MKKTNNKGFSLVELIIVIAIMAILAASLAPALIRYIDKSRKSSDLTTSSSIKSAYETAITNEIAKSEVDSLVNGETGKYALVVSTDKDGNKSVAGSQFSSEFNTNLKATLKVKYTKDGAVGFNAYVDSQGEMDVYIASNGNASAWKVQPEVDNAIYE
jgi:type IV pilus assembly protein PilA